MLKKVVGIFLVTVLFAASGYALEVGKVNLPDTINAGGSNLVLNGAGIRSKFGLKLYVAGLYLAQKSSSAQAVVNADNPMAIRIDIISKLITSEKFQDTTREGFQNSTNGNIAPIKNKIDSFMAAFNDPFKEGDMFELVYVPAKGVEVFKNGSLKITVPGLDFKKALFGIWLGDKPAQKNLKEGMLGK